MNNNLYNSYNSPYYPQNNYYNNQYQQQPVNNFQQPTIYPLVYVNGLVGAKAYFMGTNQVAYLRDSEDDSILYEKRTDAMGKYFLKAYKLTELQTDDNNTFKINSNQDELKIINAKIDAIYSILMPKQEVKQDELPKQQ